LSIFTRFYRFYPLSWQKYFLLLQNPTLLRLCSCF